MLAQAASFPGPLRAHLPDAMEEISDVGAEPLVDDPKLGWETSPGNRLLPQAQRQMAPIGTRLASESSYKITSSKLWLALALVLVLSVAAGIVVIAIWA
jgi:hypothetical protein